MDTLFGLCNLFCDLISDEFLTGSKVPVVAGKTGEPGQRSKTVWSVESKAKTLEEEKRQKPQRPGKIVFLHLMALGLEGSLLPPVDSCV